MMRSQKLDLLLLGWHRLIGSMLRHAAHTKMVSLNRHASLGERDEAYLLGGTSCRTSGPAALNAEEAPDDGPAVECRDDLAGSILT